jgi:osmoprotectant transport system ATP-binding protein
MKPDPPVIMKGESPEKAKAMLNELKADHLIVVDNEKRLMGYVDQETLTKKADEVGDIARSTDAFLPASSSLKDGLSEIFTHDLGYIIVVDEVKRVLGTLREEGIKEILRK